MKMVLLQFCFNYIALILFSILTYVLNESSSADITKIRLKCKILRDNDENIQLLAYLNSIEQFYGSLYLDDSLPSLYNFKVSNANACIIILI